MNMYVRIALTNVLVIMTLHPAIRCTDPNVDVAESSPRRMIFRKSFRFPSINRMPPQMGNMFDDESEFWDRQLQSTIDPYNSDSSMRSNSHLINAMQRLEFKFDRIVDRIDIGENVVHDIMTQLDQIHLHIRDHSESAFQLCDCITAHEAPQMDLLKQLVFAVGHSNENIRKLLSNVDTVMKSDRRSIQSLQNVVQTVQAINERTIRIQDSSSHRSSSTSSQINENEIIGSPNPFAIATRFNVEPSNNERHGHLSTTSNHRRGHIVASENYDSMEGGNYDRYEEPSVPAAHRNYESNGRTDATTNSNDQLKSHKRIGYGTQRNQDFDDNGYMDRNKKPMNAPAPVVIENRNYFAAEERKESVNFGHNSKSYSESERNSKESSLNGKFTTQPTRPNYVVENQNYFATEERNENRNLGHKHKDHLAKEIDFNETGIINKKFTAQPTRTTSYEPGPNRNYFAAEKPNEDVTFGRHNTRNYSERERDFKPNNDNVKPIAPSTSTASYNGAQNRNYLAAEERSEDVNSAGHHSHLDHIAANKNASTDNEKPTVPSPTRTNHTPVQNKDYFATEERNENKNFSHTHRDHLEKERDFRVSDTIDKQSTTKTNYEPDHDRNYSENTSFGLDHKNHSAADQHENYVSNKSSDIVGMTITSSERTDHVPTQNGNNSATATDDRIDDRSRKDSFETKKIVKDIDYNGTIVASSEQNYDSNRNGVHNWSINALQKTNSDHNETMTGSHKTHVSHGIDGKNELVENPSTTANSIHIPIRISSTTLNDKTNESKYLNHNPRSKIMENVTMAKNNSIEESGGHIDRNKESFVSIAKVNYETSKILVDSRQNNSRATNKTNGEEVIDKSRSPTPSISSSQLPSKTSSNRLVEKNSGSNNATDSKTITRKVTTKTTSTKVKTTTKKDKKTYQIVRKDTKTRAVTMEPSKRNCHDLKVKRNGVYKFGSLDELANDADRFFDERYCDFNTNGTAWTVIQRKFTNHNRESFNRTWLDYKLGFGKLDDEFWFGNDFIHKLTHDDDVELRILLENKNGDTAWVQYSKFKMKSEADNYKLVIGGFSGSIKSDVLLYHNGENFSTYDRPNGRNHCASLIGNGWWFNNCEQTTEKSVGNLVGHTLSKMLIRSKIKK